MKTKNFSFVIASLFLLILMTSFASAEFSLSATSLTFDENTNTQTFTITNLNESELLDVVFDFTTITVDAFSFEITGNTTDINNTEPREFTVTLNDSSGFEDLDFGDSLLATFQISDVANSEENQTITIYIEKSDFCEVSDLGSLDIDGIDFENKGYGFVGTYGEDDEWYAFEEIEVTVDLENTGSHDINDISLEWGLYNTDLEKWVIEVDEEDEFDLKDDHDTQIVFSFILDNSLDVDLEDLTDGDDYVLYVRATGEFDDGPHENEKTCVSDFEEASFVIEDDLVAVDNLKSEYTAECGSVLNLALEIWNIGNDDQDEIYVQIENSELDIFEEIMIDELDSFDKQKITFDINMPEGAEPGSYYFNIELFDEDGDLYENSNDEAASFATKIVLDGECKVSPTFEIFAEAEEIQEGKTGTVNVVITNLEDTTQTFDLDLVEASWAENLKLDKEYIVLKSGESVEIKITLTANKDTAGSQILQLMLVSENVQEIQPIEVEILENNGLFGISGFAIGGNAYTTGLSILIIVLVIIILIVLILRKLKK